MILLARETSLKTFWAQVSIAILTSSGCDIDKNILLMFRNQKFRLRRRTICQLCVEHDFLGPGKLGAKDPTSIFNFTMLP
jgi:hypothetical protein